jgi:ParB-like chromosome segregation protein Spo0J
MTTPTLKPDKGDGLMNKITKDGLRESAPGSLLAKHETVSVAAPETAMVSAGKPTTVKLASLRFGRDYPGGSINVRQTHIGADDGMIASVREKGISIALAVVEYEGFYYACDGDTRLDAALKVVTEARDRAEYPVNVVVHPVAEALEISLAAGVLRRDLHPVDEFEALALLIQKKGKTVDELARRFNMKVPQIRQALGLAALAPKIRQAWRDGKLEDGAAEAFRECADQALQIKAFDRVSKRLRSDDGKITYADVSRELKVEDDDEAGGLLSFVGRETFEAKGGRVDETLFSHAHDAFYNDDITPAGAPIIRDKVLLKSLAAEKMDTELNRLVGEDGWAWAVSQVDAPKDSHAWRVLEAKGGKFTNEQKATAGCIVSIDGHAGKFGYRRGLVKPGGKVSLPKGAAGDTGAGRPKKKVQGAKGAAGGAAKADLTLSNNLTQRLSEQLSAAVSEALAADARIALSAILAGFASTKKTVDVEQRGLQRKQSGGGKPANFERSFEAYLDASQANQLKVLAAIAGAAVDLQVWHADNPPLKDPATAALCAALDASTTGGQILQDALRRKFDLGDYCNSVNRDMVLLAIGEAVNADEARKLQGKPKSDVVKFALANMKATGWLPKELRTTAYAGPGSGKKPETKPAPVVKAVAKATPKKAAKPSASAKASADKKVKKTVRKSKAKAKGKR